MDANQPINVTGKVDSMKYRTGRRHGGRTVGIGVLAALALISAACGSDDTTSEPSGAESTVADTTAPAETTQPSVPAATDGPDATEPDTTDAVEPSGPATGEPLRVGFVNLEGGAVSVPEIRVGFEQGVKYVNEERNGAGGRPIEIAVSCNTDFTPESSLNCANQMVEANVDVVFNGADFAADAGLPVYQEAGIAQIGIAGFTPAFNAAEGDVFTYLWATEEGLAGSLVAMQNLGAEKMVMALADTAGARSYGATLIPDLAKEVGIEVDVQYYPADVDWATFSQGLVATSPDAIDFPAISDVECLGMVPAMHATGFDGPVHAGSCNIMLSVLPADVLAGVITHAEFTWRTMVDESTPPEIVDQIDTYEKYVGEANPDYVGGFSMLGFAVAVFGADALSTIDGELTAESIHAGLPGATGTVPFSEIAFDCSGTAWKGTSSCRNGMLFTQINEDLTRTEFDWSPIDLLALKS